jgi:hypothetical protein
MKTPMLAVSVVAALFFACGGEDPVTTPGDRDDDGIIDTLDSCPDAAENKNGYLDLDGCPDTPPQPPPPPPDSDRDGIPDASDACPAQPETVNGNTDSDGCPDLTSLYTGRWGGQATLQFEGEAPWFNNSVVLTGNVNNQRVTMSPVCPLGDGSVTTTAFTSQLKAQWTGSLDCAPIGFTNGCQYVVLTYRSMAFDLSTDGRSLGAAGGGTAMGCGLTKNFVMTFSGVRQ